MWRSAACVLVAGCLLSSCGGADPGAPPPPAAATTSAAPEPSSPPLTLEDYRAQANALCRAAAAEGRMLMPPAEGASQAQIDAFIDDVFARGDRLIAELTALRPPAEAEQEIRQQFIQPLTSQLGLAKQIAQAPPGRGEELKALAADARSRAQSYATGNGLADCAT